MLILTPIPKAPHVQKLLLLSLLVAGLSWLMPESAVAQPFTNLYGFTSGNDGAVPSAGVILSGGLLYGTALDGGSNRFGTVFSVQTNGANFTVLHSLSSNDGTFPFSGLVLSSNVLYGTTQGGGSNNFGTVFSLGIGGDGNNGFTNLHSFANADGDSPNAGLALSGTTLYGVAQSGGANGSGTVFAINTDGSGFTNLYSFSAVHTNAAGVYTNGDGAFILGALFLAGNTLYGTAQNGGTNGNGTIFALNTDGSGFTNLYTFSAGAMNDVGNVTNSDGALPSTGVILAGTTLYGTARSGGSGGNGTVFALDTLGTGLTTLYSFTEGTITNFSHILNYVVNSDGANPGPLTVSGHTLYGTGMNGGTWGNGTVFSLDLNSLTFSNLYTFSASATRLPGFIANGDGADPAGALFLGGSTLYGTAEEGGTNHSGTLFSITLTLPPALPPTLTIVSAPPNVILAWPVSATGFTLQSTPDLGSPAWANISVVPSVVDTNNVVTNAVTGAQIFFRLSQ
jgi:uncharacterized repeat protein (TIGR03803 family)